jgi:tetratricopeptide (TPR) repeat protein
MFSNSLVVDDDLAGDCHNLGYLYADQGKLVEAERIYQRALEGKEKAWGPEHTSTLDTVNNLAALYKVQGKLVEAERMYQRALEGYEKAWGPEHTSTLSTVNNLGSLYADQGKLVEAERMYQRALEGYEKAIGPSFISTYIPALNTTFNLGLLYEHQADIATARTMFSRALRGYEQVFGLDHAESETTRNKLCALDVMLGNKALVETGERLEDVPMGPAHGIDKPPSNSKRQKLLQKLGLRSRA